MVPRESATSIRLKKLQSDLAYLRSPYRTAMELTTMWSKYKTVDMEKEMRSKNKARGKNNSVLAQEYLNLSSILTSIVAHQNCPKWIRDAFFKIETYSYLDFSSKTACLISDSFVDYLIDTNNKYALEDAVMNNSFSERSLLALVNNYKISNHKDDLPIYSIVDHPKASVQVLEAVLKKAGNEFVYSIPVEGYTCSIDWAWEKYEQKAVTFEDPGEELSFLVEFAYNSNSSTTVLCKMLKHMAVFNPVEVSSLIGAICSNGEMNLTRFNAFVKEGWGQHLANSFDHLVGDRIIPAIEFIKLAENDSRMMKFLLHENGANTAVRELRNALLKQLRDASPELESAPDEMLLKVYDYA
jgi:hypothetical protein